MADACFEEQRSHGNEGAVVLFVKEDECFAQGLAGLVVEVPVKIELRKVCPGADGCEGVSLGFCAGDAVFVEFDGFVDFSGFDVEVAEHGLYPSGSGGVFTVGCFLKAALAEFDDLFAPSGIGIVDGGCVGVVAEELFVGGLGCGEFEYLCYLFFSLFHAFCTRECVGFDGEEVAQAVVAYEVCGIGV